MASYFSVTGVRDGVNGEIVPIRQEIRTLQSSNPDMFNLYLLGLRRMQSLPKTDKLSWFQISGIHGRPYAPWDGVKGIGNASGYCTHSSILFLTWHRPYLALFEQLLYGNIKAVVQEFPPGPTRDKYATLAPGFRMPYWDWAANPTVPDILLRQEEVDVEAPGGKIRIQNPLYSYSFGSIDRREFPERGYNTWLSTLRHPTITGAPAPNDRSNPARIQAQLREAHEIPNPPNTGTSGLNLRDRIYALLSRNKYQNYQYFSNDGWNNNNKPDDYDSLEAVHNLIHNIIGGSGHMSSPGYAGFDPIFWLHHTNVDRIFALWQVLNPTSYVVDQRSISPTSWSNVGTIEGLNTNLLPFHKDNATYWISATIKDLKTFGSTYPELIDWGSTGPEQVKINVQRAVQTLYGKTAPTNRVLGNAPGFAGSTALSIQSPKDAVVTGGAGVLQNDGHGDGPETGNEGGEVESLAPTTAQRPERVNLGDQKSLELKGYSELVKDGAITEYFCNARAEKYAAGGSFNVHFFLGEFNSDPLLRSHDNNLVGTFSVFANDPETTGCEKCQGDAQDGLIVTASIPLTGALLDRIPDMQTLDPDAIIPYLQENLHWRCNRPDDTPISRSDIPSLKVGVASVTVEVPTEDELLPRYLDWHPLYEVTSGRTCGIVQGDDL